MDINPVVYLIESVSQAKLIFLPPYSPDLMPLEEVFHQVKSIIKANDGIFQVSLALKALLAMAFSMFTTQDCIATVDTYLPSKSIKL